MKNIKIVIMLFALVMMGIVLTNCGDDETIESCTQDEYCAGKTVTACCTPASCIYKYNGKDYPESDIDQLADDLGCTAGSGARVASEEKEILKTKLEDLLSKARAELE